LIENVSQPRSDQYLVVYDKYLDHNSPLWIDPFFTYAPLLLTRSLDTTIDNGVNLVE